MATRRNAPQGRISPQEKVASQEKVALKSGTSDITPAVPATVIFKLLGFTLAMIAAPIGTYYATVETLFKGNATYAGATAAIIANVVLIAYVLEAMREDKGEQEEKKTK